MVYRAPPTIHKGCKPICACGCGQATRQYLDRDGQIHGYSRFAPGCPNRYVHNPMCKCGKALVVYTTLGLCRKCAKPILDADYYRRNQDIIRARTRVYQQTHPEVHLKASIKYGRAHRSDCMRRSKEWRHKHPEQATAISSRAKAKRRGIIEVGNVDYKAVIKRDKWTCHICERHIERDELSFDHLIPLAFGGQHTTNNLRMTHLKCNVKRGAGRIPAQLLMEV